MVGTVALRRSAAIFPCVRRFIGRQGTQSIWSNQHALYGIDNRLLLPGVERRIGQRHRHDLVRTEGGIIAIRTINYIEKMASGLIPESPAEVRPARLRCQLVGVRRLADVPRPGAHQVQGVEPQRVDLNRLPNSRSDRTAADAGIHPGQLASLPAREQQPVRRVHAYPVSRPFEMPAHDLGEPWKQPSDYVLITRSRHVRMERLEIPERGISRVILH